MGSYVEVVVFAVVGVLFVVVSLWFGWLLRPQNRAPEKLTTYECGEIPFGDAQIRFSIRYYMFALIFVVFDIETIFMYPWAVVFKDIGLFAFIEMVIFIGVLAIGLIYAWQKRVLKWL